MEKYLIQSRIALFSPPYSWQVSGRGETARFLEIQDRTVAWVLEKLIHFQVLTLCSKHKKIRGSARHFLAICLSRIPSVFSPSAHLICPVSSMMDWAVKMSQILSLFIMETPWYLTKCISEVLMTAVGLPCCLNALTLTKANSVKGYWWVSDFPWVMVL